MSDLELSSRIDKTIKLNCLVMDWETFNRSALKQGRNVIRALQTSTTELSATVVSNINLKTLIILAKRSILDA